MKVTDAGLAERLFDIAQQAREKFGYSHSNMTAQSWGAACTSHRAGYLAVAAEVRRLVKEVTKEGRK